jgi:hypothetical protein
MMRLAVAVALFALAVGCAVTLIAPAPSLRPSEFGAVAPPPPPATSTAAIVVATLTELLPQKHETLNVLIEGC